MLSVPEIREYIYALCTVPVRFAFNLTINHRNWSSLYLPFTTDWCKLEWGVNTVGHNLFALGVHQKSKFNNATDNWNELINIFKSSRVYFRPPLPGSQLPRYNNNPQNGSLQKILLPIRITLEKINLRRYGKWNLFFPCANLIILTTRWSSSGTQHLYLIKSTVIRNRFQLSKLIRPNADSEFKWSWILVLLFRYLLILHRRNAWSFYWSTCIALRYLCRLQSNIGKSFRRNMLPSTHC